MFAPVGLFSILAPVMLVLPVTTVSSAPKPHPVAAAVRSLPVSGVDQAAKAAEGTDTPRAAEPFVLTAPMSTSGFTTLGVTWEADTGSTQVRVQARTRGAKGWSPWAPLDLNEDEGPDDRSDEARDPALRTGTAPTWVGKANGVQVRVDVPSGPAPQDVRVDLVDPGASAADTSLGATSQPRSTAAAATRQPAIISRAQWGADESMRTADPSYTSRVRVAYVHHTASTNDYTAEEAAQQVRGFYAYHVQSLGWSDIGYNFLIDKFGRIYEGRYGGISRAVIGAHAGGFNTGAMGVSMIGTYSTVSPSAATLASMRDLLAWKLLLDGADPLGKQVVTSGGGSTAEYPAGTEVTVDVILGHRDTNATACPGDVGYSKLAGLRRSVADAMAAAPAAAAAGSPIDAKHAALGGSAGLLGAPIAAEATASAGRYRTYAGGSIYWSQATAAHEVHGDIGGTWASLARQAGPLGFPTTDEVWTPDRLGRYNQFSNGSIYWSPRTGAREVRGAIGAAWSRTGWEAGPLGYPTTNELPTQTGFGRQSSFQNGSVVWAEATGAQVLRGAIRSAWTGLGAEGGPLGFPRTSEDGTPDSHGRFSHFQSGSIYWTAATGAHEVRGAILARWSGLGWERSALGYPTSDEYAVPGGRRSDFQNGSITWTPTTGARASVG